MPHVALVPFTGLRVREQELLALGMSLPGLHARGAAIAELPALGLLTLAGMLPPDWTCSYHPASRADEELLETILAERPTLVALSALTASVEDAYQFSGKLRAAGVQVVIGGLHATACAVEAQQHCDAVVTGPGEAVWLKLLQDAVLGELKPLYTAERSAAPSWPTPRFDLLGQEPARFTLQTQRGCPLACDFCGASRLLGAFREKPLPRIEAELNAIGAFTSRPMLELADDNTFAGDRDADQLLAALRSSGARWFTEADWRIGERPEIVSQLAAAGCVQVLMGIESLVFRYPGMGEKQAELSRIMDAVLAIQESGVAVNGCFIVGAEGETPASLERLVEFILASPLAEVQITLQTPFPGTALYRRLQRQGRLLPERGWPFYTLFDVTYEPDSMSVAELEAGFREVLRQVFSAGPSQRRAGIRRRIWQAARSIKS